MYVSTPAFNRLDTHVRYLGIALATHFSSSSRVLEGLIPHSAICFAKQRVRSEISDKQLGINVTLRNNKKNIRAAIRC